MHLKIISLLFLISNCFSFKQFQPKSQGTDQDLNGPPFPGNYTLREIIETEERNANLLLSPDQNWIVYQSGDRTSYSMTFYFRRRTSSQSTQIKLGIKKLDDIIGWTFDKKGQSLFIGTFYGLIYKCKFGQNMTNEDCDLMLETNITGSYYSFSINDKNQLAVCMLFKLMVLKQSQSGKLVEIASQNYPYTMRCQDMKWDPNNEDVLIIGSCNKLSNRNGQITFFSISKNQSLSDNPVNCVIKIVLIINPPIIIVAQYFYTLSAYLINQNNLTQINISKNINATSFQLSRNEALLIIPSAGVFSLTYQTDPTPSINLVKVYPLNISTIQSIIFSQDGNQFIKSDSSYSFVHQIDVLSMCPRRTYYTTQGCSICAENCSTCHYSSNLCTDCRNNSFARFQSTCLACNEYLPGCLTCSNPQNCISCNQKANWSSIPKNGSCLCQDFYFLSEWQCKLCDSSGACRVCKSQNQCTQCDLQKGYKQKPVDSKCVCRRQFTFFNNSCVECDIVGCERCEQPNVCSSCSEEGGYESDVGSEGVCIKENSYSMIIILSIVGGFVVMFVSIYVYCKCQRKRKGDSDELNDESYFKDQSLKSNFIKQRENDKEKQRAYFRRKSVPRFEQIEQILRQSIRKSIKIEAPMAAINKKEYAKFSDEQKIRLRQLLRESMVSN